MNEEKFIEDLVKQRSQVKGKNGIYAYLEFLYGILAPIIDQKKKPLEIGAGAGTSLEFLGDRSIHRSDILDINIDGIEGGVDIQQTHFNNNEFDLVFGMDVIHHIQYPEKAFFEISRITDMSKPGISAIFIEPYVSVLSYLPYRLFHTERTTVFKNRNLIEPVVGISPSDGDQTIPRLLFCSTNGLMKMKRIFPEQDFEIQVRYISPVSFFMTGGINRPFKISSGIIERCIQFEEKIPQSILKLVACRMIIKIVRK
jgi:hypothetical protein